MPQPRGEFTKTTTIELPVAADKVTDREVSGYVKVFTDLGEVREEAPLRKGITGIYLGTMRYDGDPKMVDLGAVRFGLDVVQSDGEVAVRVRSEDSLLFPASAGEVTAKGTYDPAKGLDVTLAQTLEPAADLKATGGNLLRMTVGRRVHLQLKVNESGTWEGTRS